MGSVPPSAMNLSKYTLGRWQPMGTGRPVDHKTARRRLLPAWHDVMHIQKACLLDR